MADDVLEKAATVADSVHGVSKIQSMVTDAVENGVRSTKQVMRHGRDAAEDAVEEVKHTVKQKPFQAVGIAFAVGVVVGSLFTWIASRNR